MKTFQTRIDWWVWLVAALPTAIITVEAIVLGIWWLIIIALVSFIVVRLAIGRISYSIGKQTLTVHDSFTTRRYPIDCIESLQKVSGFLSQPAASTKRVEVKFKNLERPLIFNTLQVSPKDRDLFISELVKANPAIKVL